MTSHSDTEHGMHAHEMWHKMKQVVMKHVVTYWYNTLLTNCDSYIGIFCSVHSTIYAYMHLYRLINQQ